MAELRRTIRESWEKNWPEVHAALMGGLPQFVLARRARELESVVPVFCYHCVDAETFEADLDFLSRNGYHTIDADALMDHLVARRLVPQRSVVLSIDDGARNLYDVVFPLLQDYRMTAVAFISPRFHREGTEGVSSNGQGTAPRPCSWLQIHEMHASGSVDFQSHTYEHRYVPRWPEAADLVGTTPELADALRGPGLPMAEDFRVAKQTLERRLGKTVRHLAFPKYNGTEQAMAIAREVGYQAFWWGTLPGRPDNRPGQSPQTIVRITGEFVRRLPGHHRIPVTTILRTRFARHGPRWWNRVQSAMMNRCF